MSVSNKIEAFKDFFIVFGEDADHDDEQLKLCFSDHQKTGDHPRYSEKE